jgi:7-cyano-7-deazaguanine synthase
MKKAVVLLSGGLDSATVLAIAREAGFICHALTIDYGQRHQAELAAARRVAQALSACEHRVIALDLTAFGGSALTDSEIRVPTEPAEGIPATYVPARNTIFLALALAYAEVLQSTDIFFGANAIDYSGYPDCRPEYIAAFQRLANLATKSAIEGRPTVIHTPLVNLSKAEIIRRGSALNVDYSLTVSCYQATEQGLACGRCDACRLRRAGFNAASITDPTRYAE